MPGNDRLQIPKPTGESPANPQNACYLCELTLSLLREWALFVKRFLFSS